jgi:hypothetical protein
MACVRSQLDRNVPVHKLWAGCHHRPGKDIFAVLRGYIDESYDGKSAIPNILVPSCMVGDDSTWPYLEWDGLKCI